MTFIKFNIDEPATKTTHNIIVKLIANITIEIILSIAEILTLDFTLPKLISISFLALDIITKEIKYNIIPGTDKHMILNTNNIMDFLCT